MRRFQLSLKIESFEELARNGLREKFTGYIDGNNPVEVAKIALIEIYKIYGAKYKGFWEFIETICMQEIEKNRFGVCEVQVVDGQRSDDGSVEYVGDMQVKFTFDEERLRKKDLRREDIYYTIKKNFISKGIRCISDDDILAFADMGNKDDYANMWAIIIGLIKCDWFTETASSCVFIEDGECEDVLSQLPKLQEIMKKNQ